MEIERLQLGQSHADKCRAGGLKWRGMPPGIPPEMAIEFMAKLKAGSTIRKLTGGGKELGPAMVGYDRFKKHCGLHPEWAKEAWRISKINGNSGKGSFNRNRTHCVNGHSLSEHGRVAIHHEGYNNRQCRECERMRHQRGNGGEATLISCCRDANGLPEAITRPWNYAKLPTFMIDLRAREATAAQALEFAILTAAC